MIDLAEHCDLILLSDTDVIQEFDCGNDDLNDFFCNDAVLYQQQLLGQTYFFRLKETQEIVAAFTLSNDSIKTHDLPNSRSKKVRRDIPSAKRMRSYPAVLIGRLGVVTKFAGQGIGSQMLDLIKSMCITEDANRCRFLLVDAYNTAQALHLYGKNEFAFLFSTEEQEKEYYEKPLEEPLNTRFMYFDLLPWASQLSDQEKEQ